LLKTFENWKIIFIIIKQNRNTDNYLLFLPSCLLKKGQTKILKEGRKEKE
jgi:hypothetical protein